MSTLTIRLSEDDAARFDCSRDLEFQFDKISGRDLLELEDQVGWHIDTLEQALQGVPAVNAIGGPIYEMDGDKPKLDGGGKPVIARTYTTRTVMVMVWMCVRRANPAVLWKDFDFDFAGAEIGGDEESEGKGSTAARSKRSTTSTSRRSRTSSASRRGSSATG